MRSKDLSVRKFLRLFFAGITMTSVILLLILFWMTRDIRVVGYGLLLTVIIFAWVVIFLHYFEKKLELFTDGLCRILDDMMDHAVCPETDYEAETLFSRISHRLERLYNVMRKDREVIAKEKGELQSLLT